MKKACFIFLLALFYNHVYPQGVSVDSVIINMGPCGGMDSATFSFYNTTPNTDKILIRQNSSHPPQEFLIIDVDSNYSTNWNNLHYTVNSLCWNGHVTTFLGVNQGIVSYLQSQPDIVVLLNSSITRFTDSLTGIADELVNYANRGGTILILGSNDISSINNTNLLHSTGITSIVSPDTASFLTGNARDPLLTLVTQPLHGVNSTFSAQFTDTGFTNVVSYNGQTVSGYKTIGHGKVVYLGFNFSASFINAKFRSLIENIFEYNNSCWAVIPPTFIIVPPFDTAHISIYINCSNPGNTVLFLKNFMACSEDSLLSCWPVVVRVNLERRPCAIDSITYVSCSEICISNHSLHGGFMNYMDFGDGYISNSFTNRCHNYADTGVFYLTCIASSTFGADTAYDTVYVNVRAPVSVIEPNHSPANNTGIYHFVFASIDYVSGAAVHEDMTCVYQATVNEGSYYPFSIETGNGFGKLYIFLDMNNDGHFTPDELLYQKFQPHILSDSIAIPKIRSGLYNTPLRLRIILSSNGNIPFTFASNSDLEIEDYTLVVLPNSGTTPNANFCYYHDCSGLGVQFRNTSGGAADSLVWIYSDGTLDTGLVPFHTFPSVDSQTVTLQAYNAYGSDYETKILLNPKKPAILYSTPVTIGDTVTFSTLDYPGIWWWWWTFPDLGIYVNDTIAVRSFPNAGNYSVTVAIIWLYESYDQTSFYCNGLNEDSIVFVSVDVEGIPVADNNLNIFPNPFNESTSVIYHFDSSANILFELFDISGKRIWQEAGDLSKGWNEKKIHLSHPGSYFLKVTSGNSVVIKKIISVR